LKLKKLLSTPEVSRSRQYLRLDAKSGRSCRRNHRKQGTQSSAQFPPVGRADPAERQSQTPRRLRRGMMMESGESKLDPARHRLRECLYQRALARGIA